MISLNPLLIISFIIAIFSLREVFAKNNVVIYNTMISFISIVSLVGFNFLNITDQSIWIISNILIFGIHSKLKLENYSLLAARSLCVYLILRSTTEYFLTLCLSMLILTEIINLLQDAKKYKLQIINYFLLFFLIILLLAVETIIKNFIFDNIFLRALIISFCVCSSIFCILLNIWPVITKENVLPYLKSTFFVNLLIPYKLMFIINMYLNETSINIASFWAMYSMLLVIGYLIKFLIFYSDNQDNMLNVILLNSFFIIIIENFYKITNIIQFSIPLLFLLYIIFLLLNAFKPMYKISALFTCFLVVILCVPISPFALEKMVIVSRFNGFIQLSFLTLAVLPFALITGKRYGSAKI